MLINKCYPENILCYPEIFIGHRLPTSLAEQSSSLFFLLPDVHQTFLQHLYTIIFHFSPCSFLLYYLIRYPYLFRLCRCKSRAFTGENKKRRSKNMLYNIFLDLRQKSREGKRERCHSFTDKTDKMARAGRRSRRTDMLQAQTMRKESLLQSLHRTVCA